MAAAGGLLVEFTEPSEWRPDPPAPAQERELTWRDIRREDVGDRALALTKRPRDRLILLLAIHQRMDPAEISRLNLPQVREKCGRDYRRRVYLKQQLVRKKDVAEALLKYRRRDRESFAFCDPQEPLFRDADKPARRWRSARLGTGEIAALLEHAAKRCPATRGALSYWVVPTLLPPAAVAEIKPLNNQLL